MTNDEAIQTLSEIYKCAISWERDARLIGNVRAEDMASAVIKAIVALEERDKEDE